MFMPQCLAVFVPQCPFISVDRVGTQCLHSVLMPSVAASVLILGVDPQCSHFSVHQCCHSVLVPSVAASVSNLALTRSVDNR